MEERQQNILTFVMLCFTIMIDKIDISLLPSVYLEVCGTFQAGPAVLGISC